MSTRCPHPAVAAAPDNRAVPSTSTSRAGSTARPSVPVPPVTSTRAIRVRLSEHRQVPLQLELRDLRTVVLPFLTLVTQEEVENVLAERGGDQLAVLHDGDRLVQAARQLSDAQGPPLGVRQAPDVVLGLVG